MRGPSHWDVYLVTDRVLSMGRSTRTVVEAAVRGGVSVVQLREKELETRQFYEECLKIRDLLRSSHVPLIINDRIDIALAVDAEGAHVGQDDMPVEVARKLLGPAKIIGLSVTKPEEINEEAEKYADYLAISPVFFTSTKENIATPWGLEGIKRARSMTDLPLVAIGSIKHDNARDVISAGAHSVAVVSGIVSADDPEAATRQLVEQVRAAKTRRAE
jgi:thiamine-phosphate pyrophosphorylase